MLHEYHILSRYIQRSVLSAVSRTRGNAIYSILYYPRFHVPAVGLGTYYPWIRGSAFI